MSLIWTWRIHLFFTGPPNPYPIIKENDAETGDVIFKLGKCSPIPEDLPLIIGEALQNLRTALDHLVWQLVLSNGGTPDSFSAFPISKSAQHYKSDMPGKVKGVATDALKMIDALQPYGGGNEDLVGLHLLNNVDKHRLLLMCGAAHTATSFQVQLSATPQEIRIPVAFQWTYPLKDDAEIYRIPHDAMKFDHDPKFSFRLAFGDAEAMGSEPLLPPLARLGDLIDRIVVSFDRFMK